MTTSEHENKDKGQKDPRTTHDSRDLNLSPQSQHERAIQLADLPVDALVTESL